MRSLVFFGSFHLSNKVNNNTICQFVRPSQFNEQMYKERSYLFKEYERILNSHESMDMWCPKTLTNLRENNYSLSPLNF